MFSLTQTKEYCIISIIKFFGGNVMKNCPNCNSVFEDSNTFCSTCGTQLETVKQESAPAPRTEKTGSLVLTFISNVLSVFSLFFALVAIALPYIRVSVNVTSAKIYAHAYLYPEEGCAVFSMLFALGALVLAIIGAIMCFTQKLGAEKNFSRITKLAANVFLFILSVILVSNI